MSEDQTQGRKANSAQPLGDKSGLVSKAGVARTGAREATSAGPDGGDATVVGDTFKSPPGSAKKT